MEFTKDTQALYKTISEELEGVVLDHDLFALFLVHAGERPGALVNLSTRKETGDLITSTEKSVPEEEDGVERFEDALSRLDIAFDCTISEDVESYRGNKRVREYAVAKDRQHLDLLNDDRDDESLGEFLGYPQSAINAFQSRTLAQRIFTRVLPEDSALYGFFDNSTPVWKQYYYQFKTVDAHEESAPFDTVLFDTFVEYVPEPTLESYREAYEQAAKRYEFALKVDDACGTNFTQFDALERPPIHGLLYWYYAGKHKYLKN